MHPAAIILWGGPHHHEVHTIHIKDIKSYPANYATPDIPDHPNRSAHIYCRTTNKDEASGVPYYNWIYYQVDPIDILPPVSDFYGKENYHRVPLPPHLRAPTDPRPCVGCGKPVVPQKATITIEGGWHHHCHQQALQSPHRPLEAPYYFAWREATQATHDPPNFSRPHNAKLSHEEGEIKP